MTCFNFNITGEGEATPAGHKFPGAYDMEDPALNWNLNSTEPYPMAGPARYVSSYNVELEPNEVVIISPTNDEEGDKRYFEAQNRTLEAQAGVTEYFDSIGG
ncbi:putative endo-beta-1,4-glucanase D [Madurella mycetomatis]|uniref:Endo-beta-1,4-glucanase D n=1 Tax=Madurella mycetomatis TaxID=100816 RepID=A0A175VZ16_9PEZI|nr:putative endo-beta-1,4-glucanase D [Madurella mycetomatis]